MAAPKIRSSELRKLFSEKNDQNLHDKKTIEALRQRLNEKIQNDPKLGRKAALILESWINKSPKK
jgi:flagellar basal body-associated protein FliL